MSTTITNEDGTYRQDDWRLNHRLVSIYHENPQVLYVIATSLKAFGYRFFENYVENNFGEERQTTKRFALCVDLTRKDIFNGYTSNPSVSLEKFFSLCCPLEKEIKIGEYVINIVQSKKIVKIGCQNIPKEKVKEILDILNSK